MKTYFWNELTHSFSSIFSSVSINFISSCCCEKVWISLKFERFEQQQYNQSILVRCKIVGRSYSVTKIFFSASPEGKWKKYWARSKASLQCVWNFDIHVKHLFHLQNTSMFDMVHGTMYVIHIWQSSWSVWSKFIGYSHIYSEIKWKKLRATPFYFAWTTKISMRRPYNN